MVEVMAEKSSRKQSPRHLEVFVVMRIDAGIEDTESAVTIKEIVPTLAEARQEVERLMQQAPAGALYTWQAARYLPNGRSGKSGAVVLMDASSEDVGDNQGRAWLARLDQAS